jgi:hypothetical protein
MYSGDGSVIGDVDILLKLFSWAIHAALHATLQNFPVCGKVMV